MDSAGKNIDPNQINLISVIIPAFNESSVISTCIQEISTVMEGYGKAYEIIVVDDGSSDNTYQIIKTLSQKDPHIKALRFSRNFGKESALFAGLRAANGNAAITMDGDLQHPPETIPLLLEKWADGYQIVRAVKKSRDYDGFFSKWRAALFNYIFKKLGGIDLKNSSDYILLDCETKNVIVNKLQERKRFYRGLVHWIGFKQTVVYFDVAERWDKGQSKWSLMMLINLAVTALVSFSSLPLRIITGLGVGVFLIGFVVGFDALLSWYFGNSVSGFTTIVGLLLIIGSFIMISLGIIGEYLSKIYDELKSRPTYLVAESTGFERCNQSGDGNQSIKGSIELTAEP
jgi:polyisoprenyl-phosphate glycosyltransferase